MCAFMSPAYLYQTQRSINQTSEQKFYIISLPESPSISASPPVLLKKTRKVEKGTEGLGRVEEVSATKMFKILECVIRK